MAKTAQEKFQTIIQKNTFYPPNSSFEQEYEGCLNLLKETLLLLRNEIAIKGLTKDIFDLLLVEKPDGL